MSGVVCAGSRYTEDRILVPKYYLRDRREGEGGASLGGLQPRNVWFRGCGGVWRGAGYRCTISIFCPKRHSNYTVKCSWELVLFLRLKLVRGDSYREMNTTLQLLPAGSPTHHHGNSQRTQVQEDVGNTWSKSIFLVLKCILALRRAGRWPETTFMAITQAGLRPAAWPPHTPEAEAQRETEDADSLGRLALRGAGCVPAMVGRSCPGWRQEPSISSGQLQRLPQKICFSVAAPPVSFLERARGGDICSASAL